MLYIHIPYCAKKCIYCDFYSAGNPDWKQYLTAVASELSMRIDEIRGGCLNSIYIGGGTPSLIPSVHFKSFFETVFSILKKEKISLGENMEITLEVNPEDVNLENIQIWKESGINRISMGVQSLNDEELKIINRRHSSDKALFALSILKQYFNNISVDIIYGLPGQTILSLKQTLDKLLEYKPNHVSAYALTYEPGAPLSYLRKIGKIEELDEDKYIEFSNLIDNKLKEENYIRYEISNYAQDGFESRHNKGYWNGEDYLGLGPSACSYDGKAIRRSNPSDIKSYIKFFNKPILNSSFFYKEEILSAEELKEEDIFTSLRTAKGLDLERFEKKFGALEMRRLLHSSAKWIKSDDMKINDGCLKLTAKGIFISDYIILSLI